MYHKEEMYITFIAFCKFAFVHFEECTLCAGELHVLFLIHEALLISSPVKQKTMIKMSQINLTPVMQVKFTLAHLHGEMKYEAWRVSPFLKIDQVKKEASLGNFKDLFSISGSHYRWQFDKSSLDCLRLTKRRSLISLNT